MFFLYRMRLIYWLLMMVRRWYRCYCQELMPEFDTHLFLEERKGKLGLGTAYMDLIGAFVIIMIIFLKWMRIFHIIHKI